MPKLPQTLTAILLLLVTGVFAQSGSFTVTSPCNSYNQGEFIWSFTWSKLIRSSEFVIRKPCLRIYNPTAITVLRTAFVQDDFSSFLLKNTSKN